MKNLTKSLVGKNIRCGEEWYGGFVFYMNIYVNSKGEYLAEQKIYINSYTGKIEKTRKNAEVFVPFGFSIVDSPDICVV